MWELLRCPVCRDRLHKNSGELVCRGQSCGIRFPVVGGVPILIHEGSSVFRIEDIAAGIDVIPRERSALGRALGRLLPSLGDSIRSRRNFQLLAELTLERSPAPRVLVIGGAALGGGMEVLLDHQQIELIESDVRLDSRTALVCDAHDIPFEDETFDAVIVQAVLEHVVDPFRCVEETHRVLKADGLVYAETPFMQQVHEGPYDFMRFSPLGHRRLFRRFVELRSGSGGGPGVVLAWSFHYFLRGFASTQRGLVIAKVVARLTAFWLKYVDRFLIDRPGAQDGTWGYYFVGRKSDATLSDRELLTHYRGIM